MNRLSTTQLEVLQAFIGGYFDTAMIASIDHAKGLLDRHFPDFAPIDGMIVSRFLRKAGFSKSYDDPVETAANIYRRIVTPEEVPH